MEDASEFDDLKNVYAELAGETAMLLGRWIYFAADHSPLARINLVAHMRPKREPEGGLSVEIRYSVDLFIREGWKTVDGRSAPHWRIRMHQEPGDWDADMLASCAKLGRDPVREICGKNPEARNEVARLAPELAALFEQADHRRDIPVPEFTSGKERSKSL